ncbi:MAG: sodium/proline symporter [Arenicella sp.]
MINTLDAIIIYIDFFIYFVAMFLLGCYALTKTQGNEGFIIGGRSVGPVTSAISAGASDMSSWLILGLPGAVYAGGLVAGFWICLGAMIGSYLNWRLVAENLRKYSENLNAITIPGYLQKRFNAKGKIIKTFAAIVILIFFTLYVASGLKGGSLLFSYVFDSSLLTGYIITTVVVVSYTLLGGYLAVCWTDLIQGLLILASLAFLAIFGFYTMNEANIDLEQVKPGIFDLSMSVISAASFLAWGIGYCGQPHILSRFMGIRSVDDIPKARRIATTWMVLCLIVSMSIGIIGIGYGAIYPLPGVEGLGGDKERIFLVLTYTIFHPVFAGLILAAVLAALMSTADSQLLVLSAALTEDMPFFDNVSDEKRVWISRSGVMVFATIALLIALNDTGSILTLVGLAWGGFGAALGPVMILSVCWRGTTQAGAIAGMISGAVSIAVFENFVSIEGEYFYELLPSFFISLFVIIIVSLITPKPSEEILEQLD